VELNAEQASARTPLDEGMTDMAVQLTLEVVPGRFAVARLGHGSPAPDWAMRGDFWSITATADELSVVCRDDVVPADVRHEPGWACLKLVGPFAFDLTGILTAVLIPLRDAGIGIFAMSTFDTDYVLVADTSLPIAVDVLRAAGHTVS
jgi:uncharacterized protein